MPLEFAGYDPSWPQLGRQASAELGAALPGLFSMVEHVGSTSVPGLSAKPIISNSVRSKRRRRWAEFRLPASLPAYPVLYGQCWPGMILQGQLLYPSQEAVDSPNK